MAHLTAKDPVRFAVRRALLLGAIAVSVSQGNVALAQQNNPDDALEEVVVTGSRLLRNRDFIAASPVQTVSLEEIQFSGNVTLEDTLNEFPQLNPDNTGTVNQSGGSGVLSADLRGLGAVRTLVLVDGKRYVPGDVTGLVDLATVPDMLVQRVEIITGGASAVYGSDAIAGAVNFILRDDFEGAEVRYQYGQTGESDGENNKVDILLGANAADGRGNVTIHASYTKRDPVFMGDRAFSQQPLLADSTGQLNNFGSGNIPGGLIGVPSSDFGLIQGVDLTNSNGSCPGAIQGVRFGDDGSPFPFCRPTEQYNYAAPNFLLRPLERWQVSALGSYDVGQNVEAYAQLFYTKKENEFQQAPEAVSPTGFGLETGTVLIPDPAANPLYPQPLRDFFAANAAYFDADGDGIYTVTRTSRRFEEFGPRNTSILSDSLSLTGGLKGSLSFSDKDWKWDAFYQFQRSDYNLNQQGRLSQTRTTLGLDVVIVNGEPQCAVDLLNCVPVNIFGTNTLTPEMADFLQVTTGREDKFDRKVAGATIAGELFELPAGAVSTAFGLEWRDESFSTVPDESARSGDLGGVPPIINGGDIDVAEVFAEARFPIVQDLPGIQSLAIEAAVRYSDYSTIDGVTTWKAGLDWGVNDWVRARASYNVAIRAPNLDELFGAPSSGFVGGVDPCVVDNNPTPEIKQVCIAQGVPPAIVDNLQVGASQGWSAFSGGNINLSEEESDTFSVGFVLTPSFLEGLSVAVDYFDITVDGAINQVSSQALVNSCFQTLDINSIACQSITRLSTGNIDRVNAPLLNLATREVSGVDLQVSYVVDLPDSMAIAGHASQLDLRFVSTWQFDDRSVALAGQPGIDCAGFYGGSCSSDSVRITPDFRGLLTANWNSGPLSLGTQIRMIGDLDLSADAFPNQNGTLDAVYYWDLDGRYRFSEKIEAFIGVTNVTDKQPPVIGFRAGGDSNTNIPLFDPLGRRFFGGVTVRF
ncbi:MAG: TonB-dependent receptor [Gammaproteobacteria bacterium]|nr:TonB-dependent receptor [Gammaproteobacteria bacterium]MDH4315639.1 TonB-dependent receptor [Gammaproteobacteria bacterium]MDH5214452.1 TonB-dependent receptor [Gammaproteobacteria bacterium]